MRVPYRWVELPQPESRLTAAHSHPQMPDSSVFSFGNCELRVGVRELRRDHALLHLPPRVFDLLLLLLTERHRIVSKRELLTTLWGSLAFSESVLARTVMHARRAIDDAAAKPRWIENSHGFGYRFIGEVHESEGVEPMAAMTAEAMPGAGGQQLRIGLLPCQNRTGDAGLDWAQAGLMALVGNALERHQAAIVVPIDRQLRPARHETSADDDGVERIVGLLGVDRVVQASLRRQRGALWMDYQVHGKAIPPLVGSLRDNDLMRLGERFAQALASDLQPGRTLAQPFLSVDGFVNQAYARATQLAELEQWLPAERLFAAACVLEPDNLFLAVARVRCLIPLNDQSAVGELRALLARLALAHEPRLQCICHDLMADILRLQIDGVDGAEVTAHRAAALAIAERGGREQWSIVVRLNAAEELSSHLRYAQARVLFAGAEADCRATGNRLILGYVLQNLALVDQAEGDLVTARQRLEEAVHIWRQMEPRPVMGHALACLGFVNGALGLVDEALAQCDEAVQLFEPRYIPAWGGLVMTVIAATGLGAGRASGIERALALFHAVEPPVGANHPPMQAVLGASAQARGAFFEACEHYAVAIEHGLQWPGAAFVAEWSATLLRLQLAMDDPPGVARSRERIGSLMAQAPIGDLRAALLAADAADRHHHGDDDAALKALTQLIEQVPMGQWQHLARLDAAWLCAERGKLERAGHFLSGLNAWRRNHAFGLAVEARLHAARGDFTRAAQCQEAALSRWHRAEPHLQRALGGRYTLAASAEPTERPPIPRLPRLMSLSWEHPG